VASGVASRGGGGRQSGLCITAAGVGGGVRRRVVRDNKVRTENGPADRMQSPYDASRMANGRFVVRERPAGVGQQRSCGVPSDSSRWPTTSVPAWSATMAHDGRGDLLPSRNVCRRMIDDITGRCCSGINELRGTRAADVARLRSDTCCCIGRAATNGADLIIVGQPPMPTATTRRGDRMDRNHQQ
jgi:hypothetical protein